MSNKTKVKQESVKEAEKELHTSGFATTCPQGQDCFAQGSTSAPLPHRFEIGQSVRHRATEDWFCIIGLILEYDAPNFDAPPCVGYRLSTIENGERKEIIAWETELVGDTN